MLFTDLGAALQAYVKDKQWYWYLPLWFIGVLIFIQLLRFDMIAGLSIVLMPAYSFDFTLHEFAHIFTSFLPAVLTASAGSLVELLLGSSLVVGAFYFRNYFASMFCLLWFDLACQSAGTYMADAIPERLPLVSLGGALSGQDPVHDWHFVFSQLHMLSVSAPIGNTIRFIGHIAGFVGVTFAVWIIYKMAVAASEPKLTAHFTPEPLSGHTVARGVSPDPVPRAIYPMPTKGTLAPHPDPTEHDKPNAE